MVETLQNALRKFDGDPVDTGWAYQIVCGLHGVEQMALRNFIQSGSPGLRLKVSYEISSFPPETRNFSRWKPLPGETITTYTNRWFNGVDHTWVE
jgi:hypothetical protein